MRNQRGLNFCFIFVTIFLVTSTNTCLGQKVACFEHERLALLEFKHSVNYTFEMLSSWVGNDCCRWERVHCDNITGHVESLRLRGGFNLDISDESEEFLVGSEVIYSLSELKHLKYLDLSGNYFQGSQIPKFIGSFKLLSYLNLSFSGFSGNIPHHIGNLSNLKVLDFCYSSMMTDDMTWISGLPSLKYLDLSYMDLSGAQNNDMVFYMIPLLEELRLAFCGIIPPFNSSATLSNINHLDLRFSDFKGQFPSFFQNMTSLEFLDISHNYLSRTVSFPNLLNIIPSLQELHLDDCGIQNMHLSPTHLNFSTLSNIQVLDLSLNSFEDNFPSVLTNLSSLRVLYLVQCGLNSRVPIMPNLLELDLSHNSFEQIEHLGIWRQCHLKILSVLSNDRKIEMIDSSTNVSECSQYALERLYLYDSFYGTIPESLGRLQNLRDLDLSRNELAGSIPESIERLENLRSLDLSRNGLTGSIPESLGRLSGLRELRLLGNGLTSSVPASLLRLSLLEELDLSDNQLNGSIPESLGSLAALKVLILENNHLTGSIPKSLGRLLSLQTLSVSSNLLNETIPISVRQLSKLKYVDISNNSLEGVVYEGQFDNLSVLKYFNAAANNKLTFNIARDWMPPFQLTSFNVSSCKIANEFPQWLQTQRKLQLLALSDVSISGPLPTWLQKMPIIPFLDLSHNNLSGSLRNLPNEVTYYMFGVQITGLYLQNNVFNESIPFSLCKRTNLEFLDLSKNKLTGKIPKCLGNLKRLKTMIFSSNRLSGVIPSSIAPHDSSLVWLNLNDNNFGGDLPRELGNLGDLIVLDLGNNRFSGKVPKWIGEKLTQLIVFRLHKNNFSGRIPRSLCKNPCLQIFDVAYNNITGIIPHCLGGLDGMVRSKNVELIYSDSDQHVIQVMKGVELEYTKTLKFVINMDLSSNKLFGGIPTKLTALASLVGLNLSNNILTGCIPESIGKMDALNSLDLSGNQLTGKIPQSMEDLHFLSYLNLSYNNLSGRIPTGNQLQTLTDPSIYVGNRYLCGAPLPRNCSNHEDLNTSHNKAADEPKKVWFYMDVACGFATGFWGIIGVLVFKKQWRHKLFMFSEVTMDKIYVAIVVRVAKMKRRNDAA